MSTRNSTSPQIYRQPSAGTVVTQLTKGPHQHIQPDVSPDGAEIAYAGDDNGTWDIWIMPAAGGPRENLTSTPDLNEVAPAWHPGGRILAFVCERAGTREQWVCAKARGAGGVSWITQGSNPCWSPAGDTLVFQRAKKRGRREESLWAVSVTVDVAGLVSGGTESQILANTAWGIVEPEYSPDGRRIAFTAIDLADGGDREKRGDIWCVRVDGTDLIRLTNTPEADYDPAWAGSAGDAKTNGRIFFASWRNGHQNIWSLMPALSGPPGALEGTGE
jgi:Tol biopolymer transport system component